MTIFAGYKETRSTNNFCKHCKTLNWTATKQRTKFKCKICKVTFSHDTTYTPVYCDYCSKKQNICQRCGISLE